MPLGRPAFLIERGRRPNKVLYAVGAVGTADIQINLDHVVLVRRQLTTRPDFRPDAKNAHGVPPDRGVYGIDITGRATLFVLINGASTVMFWS